MSAEQRSHERSTAHAKAVFVDTMTPGYLRDLSSSGCQVAFMAPVPAQEGLSVKIQVIPVHDPAQTPFQLLLDVRWIRNDPLWYLMGGKIRGATSEDTASLEKLIAYYVEAPRE
jgi:hypothetical protein